MFWTKQGRIFVPDGSYSWNKSHAQVPVVDVVNDDVWRIYYATRDEQNRSRTSFIQVEAGNPGNILYVHDRPILELGKLGAFDDCGVMPSWIVTVGEKKFLYYIGWTVRTTIPYHNSIGLAISHDGGWTFDKFAEGPLFSATPEEPYFTGTSCVMIDNGVWKNWYLSCTKWEIIDGKPEPFYHIKYAESDDGIHWRRDGTVAIDYASKDEGGIVSASVLKADGMYSMWYGFRSAASYRTDRAASYRIGYAESDDGIRWVRKDHLAGIDIAEDGWDSEMLSYPHVVKGDDHRFMFYNGNGFGRSGFGYATQPLHGGLSGRAR